MRHFAAQEFNATPLLLLPFAEAPVLLINVNIANHLVNHGTASLQLNFA